MMIVKMIFRNNLSALSWLFFLPSLFEVVQATTLPPDPSPAPKLPDPAGLLADPCQKNLPLTPEVWVELQIDNYLDNYPNLEKMTLVEFAAQVNAQNFNCGVGLHCLAGQICYPVRGINWIILYAIQQWNSWLNISYAAIEQAIDLMRDASAAIISDFMPLTHEDHSLFGWSVATIVVGVLASFSAIIVPVLMAGKVVIASLDAYHSTASVAELAEQAYHQAQAAKQAGQMGTVFKLEQGVDSRALLPAIQRFSSQPKPSVSSPKKLVHWEPPPNVVAPFKQGLLPHDHATKKRLRKRKLKPPPSVYSYQRWAVLDSHLTEIQNRIQSVIYGAAVAGTTAPMLTDSGLAVALKGGGFLSELPSMDALQKKGKALAQITALSEFFKSLNMFITVGCDKCDDKGPNGAWPQDEFLSYCSPQKVMMNIIRAEGVDSRNKIRNANWVKDRYGYTTEFLVTNAINCQNKYGFYTEQKAPPPEDEKSECVFQLPVCQCSLPAVNHFLSIGKGTVRACRQVGVPI